MDVRNAIAEQLKKDYTHRDADDAHCAICGVSDEPLAFHVIEKSVSEKNPLPDGFVALSHSRGFYRGSFPLCSKCAPSCKKCSLPIVTKNAVLFAKKADAKIGNGFCHEHIHAENLIDSLTTRLGSLSIKSRLIISLLIGIALAVLPEVKAIPVFLASTLISFVCLAITAKILSENNIGFKRLTFVCAVIAAFLIPMLYRNKYYYLNESLLIGVSAFFVVVAVMAYGKSIALWVLEGFGK